MTWKPYLHFDPIRVAGDQLLGSYIFFVVMLNKLSIKQSSYQSILRAENYAKPRLSSPYKGIR